MNKGTLTLHVNPGPMYGQPVSMTIELPDNVVYDVFVRASKPPAMVSGFDELAESMRAREFRKDLFIRECTRIGELLAQTMADAEGWHDASRVKPARDRLRGLV